MTADGDAGDRVRTALVTGGTGGMGRVIAAQLAADGFDVAVAYAGSVDLADATVKEIAGQGGAARRSRRTSPTRRPYPLCSTPSRTASGISTSSCTPPGSTAPPP